MPKRYGDDPAANLRLGRWQELDVWGKILRCAIQSAHRQDKISMIVMIMVRIDLLPDLSIRDGSQYREKATPS